MEREIPLYMLEHDPLIEAVEAVTAPSARVACRHRLRLGRSEPSEGVRGR